jgi:hypothetical protein
MYCIFVHMHYIHLHDTTSLLALKTNLMKYVVEFQICFLQRSSQLYYNSINKGAKSLLDKSIEVFVLPGVSSVSSVSSLFF